MTPLPDDPSLKLIDAAGPLFAEKGLRATPVREICRDAGVNLASINYHFRDKDQLYIRCVQVAGANCMASVPLPDWPVGTPPTVRLRDFIRVMLERVAVDREPAWHAQLIMREMVNPTPACAEFVREFVRPNFLTLSGILAELIPNAPETRRLLSAFSIVGQILHYRFCRPVHRMLLGPEVFRALDLELLASHIYDFSMSALERVKAESNRRR